MMTSVQTNTMALYETITSYSQQVIDAADADGNLSVQLASRLLEDHSTSLYEMEKDGYKGSWCHAPSLLTWLGY